MEVSSHERSFYYFIWTNVLALFSPLLGLIFGNVDQDDYFMRNLSIDLQVTTLNVEYRFVPEYPSLHLILVLPPADRVAPGHLFPTQLNDSSAALKWVTLLISRTTLHRL